MRDDPHLKARARYAFMLRLPHDFSDEELVSSSRKHEECRYGMAHAAWRAGYFGHEREVGPVGEWTYGRSCALQDLCPIVPPGLSIEDAQRDWRDFERYWAAVREARRQGEAPS